MSNDYDPLDVDIREAIERDVMRKTELERKAAAFDKIVELRKQWHDRENEYEDWYADMNLADIDNVIRKAVRDE